MSTNELNYLDSLISEMKEKEAEVKKINEEIEITRAIVREIMILENLSKMTTANYHITYSQCEQTRVNKKTLQNEYPDIFGKVAKITQYMMLRIN